MAARVQGYTVAREQRLHLIPPDLGAHANPRNPRKTLSKLYRCGSSLTGDGSRTEQRFQAAHQPHTAGMKIIDTPRRTGGFQESFRKTEWNQRTA